MNKAKITKLKTSSLTTEEFERLGKKEANVKWLFKHYDELSKKYSDKFIAVRGKRVIDNSVDYEKLVKELHNKYGDNFCTIAIKLVLKKEIEHIPTIF